MDSRSDSLTLPPPALDRGAPGRIGAARWGPIRFLDLTDDRCAFIADDPQTVAIDELFCCGARAVVNGSLLGDRYCAAHRALVLVPQSRARPA